MQTALIIIGVVIIVLFVAVQVVKRKIVRGICRYGAAKIYRQLRGVYGGAHHFKEADRAEFEDEVELGRYDEVRASVLEHDGCELGAIENLTVSEADPDHRTLLEVYKLADGLACVSTYQLEDQQFVDVVSETNDGKFIVTTNAVLDKLTPPPEVSKRVLDEDTPVADLFSAHMLGLHELEESGELGAVISFDSLGDVIDSQKRFTEHASKYRQSIGFLTESEIFAMVEDEDGSKAGKMLWAEFQNVSRLGDEPGDCAA